MRGEDPDSIVSFETRFWYLPTRGKLSNTQPRAVPGLSFHQMKRNKAGVRIVLLLGNNFGSTN